MSGKHSPRDQWGRQTDSDGDVTSIVGTIEEPKRDRPYTETPER